LGRDFQVTALIDQLDAIERQIEVTRPRRKETFKNVILSVGTLALLYAMDVPWAWLVGAVVLLALSYLAHLFPLRKLEEQRGRLLAQMAIQDGQRNDVP
jgi:amino acid transporter